MSHLADINEILKRQGLGFVKISDGGSWDNGKKYVSHGGISSKGFKGGSIGPMTMTNAHMDHNRKKQSELVTALTPLVNEIATNDNGFCIVFELKPGNFRHISFDWRLFPTYSWKANLDNGYKSYWLIATITDSKTTK